MSVRLPGLVRRLRELGEDDVRIRLTLLADLGMTNAEAQAVLDDPREQLAPIDVRGEVAVGERRAQPTS